MRIMLLMRLEPLQFVGSALFSQRIDDLSNVLTSVTRHDEQGIFGLDDDEVVNADQGDDFFVPLEGPIGHDVSGSIDGDGFVGHGVTAVVFGSEFPCGLPGAHIAPTEVGGYHGQGFDFFHDADIDAHGRKGGEDFFQRGLFVAVGGGPVQGIHAFGQKRQVFTNRIDHLLRMKKEKAGVPQEFS
mgnify:CR=1 FL=1